MSWALASACVCYGEPCPGDLGAGPLLGPELMCINVCPPYVIFRLWRLGVCGVCVNSFIHCGWRRGFCEKYLYSWWGRTSGNRWLNHWLKPPLQVVLAGGNCLVVARPSKLWVGCKSPLAKLKVGPFWSKSIGLRWIWFVVFDSISCCYRPTLLLNIDFWFLNNQC